MLLKSNTVFPFKHENKTLISVSFNCGNNVNFNIGALGVIVTIRSVL